MIRLTILYPNMEGKKFDKDYYLNTHMPLTLKLQGDAVKHVSVEFGFSGGAPGSSRLTWLYALSCTIHSKHLKTHSCPMQKC